MILALGCRCGRPKDEKKMLLKIIDYKKTALTTTNFLTSKPRKILNNTVSAA
jgi:hypothetical protein